MWEHIRLRVQIWNVLPGQTPEQQAIRCCVEAASANVEQRAPCVHGQLLLWAQDLLCIVQAWHNGVRNCSQEQAPDAPWSRRWQTGEGPGDLQTSGKCHCWPMERQKRSVYAVYHAQTGTGAGAMPVRRQDETQGGDWVHQTYGWGGYEWPADIIFSNASTTDEMVEETILPPTDSVHHTNDDRIQQAPATVWKEEILLGSSCQGNTRGSAFGERGACRRPQCPSDSSFSTDWATLRGKHHHKKALCSVLCQKQSTWCHSNTTERGKAVKILVLSLQESIV